MKTCGCGRTALWEVYIDRQPHCTICMEDATDCKEMVLVRKIDVMESWKSEQKQPA